MFIQILTESSCIPMTLAIDTPTSYLIDSVAAGIAHGILSGAAKLITCNDETLIGKAGIACGYLAELITAVSFAVIRSKSEVKVKDAILYGAKPICKN